MTDSFEEKMLRQIKLQSHGLTDQYNSMDNIIDENDYENVVKSTLGFTPNDTDSYMGYYEKLKIYVKLCSQRNIKTHIAGPKGAWYTHRNPQGCFACDDLNLMSIMCDIIGLMASRSPDTLFKTS